MRRSPVNYILSYHVACCLLVLAIGGCEQTEGRLAVSADAPERAPLGLNLAGVSYYGTEIPFVDVFRVSGDWLSQAEGKPFGQGGPLDLTDSGDVRRLRPRQFAEKILFPDMGTHYPGGTYTCLYEGAGELDLALGAKVTERAPGRLVVDVTPANGPIAVRILKTDPDDPIRSIRLIQPGFEDTYAAQPFHPDFLARAKLFSVLRFMDWGRTNHSPLIHWEERTTLDSPTQGSEAGVCFELMIDLANQLDVDPWFCVPHQADDNFVRQMARLVKARLEPERTIYLEYSNEVWNLSFAQARYAAEKGRELQLGNSDFESQLRYYSRRSVEIFKIWEEEFGSTDRLVRVLSTQSVNTWTATTVLDFEDADQSADAIATAFYFGNRLGNPDTADEVAQMSIEEILAAAGEDLANHKQYICAYGEIAADRNLKFIAYEGGQHLVGYSGAENNEALEAKLIAANRHPMMKELYRQNLDTWQDCGGGLYCLFSSMSRSSKWGSWGLLEFGDQDPATAPKYQAVLEYLGVNERRP